MNKVSTEVANNFNLGLYEGDIEELLEVVSEKLTDEELLELEQQHIVEEEAKGNCRRKKRRTPQKNS